MPSDAALASDDGRIFSIIRKMVKRHALPFFRIGRSYRFNREQNNAHLRKANAAPAVSAKNDSTAITGTGGRGASPESMGIGM
jgi:hypothetical protein